MACLWSGNSWKAEAPAGPRLRAGCRPARVRGSHQSVDAAIARMAAGTKPTPAADGRPPASVARPYINVGAKQLGQATVV